MIFTVNKEDERKTGVYCITNTINNKIYVGSTSANFRHRFLQYRSGFKRKLDNQPVLYRAFNKYGFDNFKFEVLCICSKEDCIKMEQFYIDKGVDYNCCLVAGSLLGLKHSKNSKTRTIIRGDHHDAVAVDKYSKTGKFISTYTSITGACEENNIKSKSNIVCSCIGNVYSAGGFRWAYKGEKLNDRPNRLGKHRVALYNDDGFYKEFKSQGDCARYLISVGNTSCGQGNVSNAIKRKIKIYNYNIKNI